MTRLGVPGPADDSPTPEGPTSTTTTTTTAPPKPTPGDVPAGYQRVTGPAGMRTVIPTGWRTQRSSGPGAMQAVDPADADRYVKYGGSAAPLIAIETSHIRYENDFAVRAPDYRRLKLDSATYGGHDAVEWEFEHRDGDGILHVRSLYWRADGKEYFVLVAAPAARWTAAKPIYDTMIAHATP
ncbi:MAG TPA: hypothetical protein VGX25_33805 [Actinophytocola sp.]|uniref:hypothetical protein n=1 Tax=Actinophytocola sp. TaxID=1872138 RepID=UPI002DDCA579|nr:hypothetical protein [Actinophytocola sp.]HEV2784389.1 hypothetical protein [Actinophytocola sp.]